MERIVAESGSFAKEPMIPLDNNISLWCVVVGKMVQEESLGRYAHRT